MNSKPRQLNRLMVNFSKMLSRAFAFFLTFFFLAIVVSSIFNTNNVVEDYTSVDYRESRTMRMIVQIRTMVMKSLADCQSLVLESGNLELQEACLSSLDASYAQIVDEYTDVDVEKIRSDLDSIYKDAEVLIELSNKSRLIKEKAARLKVFSEKINELYAKLGIIEAKMWAAGAGQYSNMLKNFRTANRMGLVSVGLVVIIMIYLVFVILLKEKTAQELVKAQEKLEMQKMALVHSSKMSALGEMATNIGHEINNPLAVISVKAEKIARLSQKNTLDAEVLSENLSIILSMTKRITNIIKGLKSYARDGSADPFVLTKVTSIIEESIELSRANLLHDEINLTVEVFDNELAMECRTTQISQVIVNLIGNARDAISGIAEQKWIRIKATEDKENIVISVIDCGGGIPDHIQEKMFMPFFTTKEVGKGTGLGLSISISIVEAHHGKIYVDKGNKNTAISFNIPKIHKKEMS